MAETIPLAIWLSGIFKSVIGTQGSTGLFFFGGVFLRFLKSKTLFNIL